ncbi:MAG: methionyl-tRNA formyltransferase [Candidatus Acidiferrum sp.]
MRLVFCGTPQFAVPALRHLLEQADMQIAAVITQPDRPRGRGQEISFSPVKKTALEAGILIHQPQKIRAPESQQLLEALAPEVIVIIAYGQIIPARLLAIPKLGWINLHASLLPKYRGAAPINWAIVNGEVSSGLSTMRIDAGMDTGDILLQEELSIGASETAPELAERMSEAGAPLMAKTLRALDAETLRPRPQNHDLASAAPLLKKEDGRIDWKRSAQEIFNRIRGLAPWPGTSTTFRGQNCQIWGQPFAGSRSAPPLAEQTSPPAREQIPGTIISAPKIIGTGSDHPNWLVICGHTTLLRLSAVKLEGRKQISASEFANGVRLASGDHFQ